MSDSRTKLIETGAELIWQFGYTATSPRQVMAASGVGQGSFYHHFPAKTDLGAAAIAANARAIVEAAEAALAGPEPGLVRVRRYLLAERDALAGCKIGGLAYDRAVLDDPRLIEPIGDAFRQVAELLESALRDAQEAGAVRADLSAAEMATMAVSVVQGGYIVARARSDAGLLRQAASAAYALLDPNDGR
ncbi:TetR/AcrR family transcriptional regulator [Amycolatopsis orientalis]|uniref:TetR/AcrR family transcriptional regulator n=1 Tax=Amycolatopsis orientalis TaxID=31958 RepID=UPI00039B835C|nr:TetR/AcrR family transcriptional regulator [Amycolatopsis orientalis]